LAARLYGIAALTLGACMILLALRVWRERSQHVASKRLFGFSILYLFVLFAMLLIDRMSGGLLGHFAA
jgi:heme o synthase